MTRSEGPMLRDIPRSRRAAHLWAEHLDSAIRNGQQRSPRACKEAAKDHETAKGGFLVACTRAPPNGTNPGQTSLVFNSLRKQHIMIWLNHYQLHHASLFLDSDNREAEANVIIFRMHSVAIWYRFISKFVVARFAISGPKAARRSNRLDHDKMTLLFGFLRRAHKSHEINDTAPFGC